MAAQDVQKADLTDVTALPQILNFENQETGDALAGWMANPAGTIFADNKIVHGGKWAARLERKAGSAGGFSTLHRAIAMDFAGKTVELRGFLRLDQVEGFTGLWMREDGEDGVVAFDNMQRKQLKGTSDWAEYSITLPVQPEGRQLFFGILLSGTGSVWADDLQLLVDGKPVWQAAKVERPQTAMETDKQFNGGSGLTIATLSQTQIENLATLGKVWGFLKYHHPLVASGKFHWDFELLRVLPTVLQADNRVAANAAVLKWIRGLGPIKPCTRCATLDENDLYMRPDVKWIADEKLLGAELSQELQSIYRNRAADGKQFYIALQENASNPAFNHELTYRQVKLPDPGFQLLGLYRFWNIVEYWSPYRDLLEEDWNKILVEFIPRIMLARTADEYQRELIALIARMHDGHANLWSSLAVRPPTGDCQLPVTVRFIENRAVVYSLAPGEAAKQTGLQVGDAITELDGVPVTKLVAEWTPYYAASNDAARLRDMGFAMTRGSCGEASVRILRGDHELPLKPKRGKENDSSAYTHDLPGETFRMLSKDVAYLKLSTVKSADAVHYVEAAAGAKGLIIDIRNYPSEFMVFALGSLLVERETPFARFTISDLVTPGAFHWKASESLKPQKPHFAGKVVVLVDEISMSQSEYTAMTFRSSGALVVGSTTAGADGNVSPFGLPGGLRTMISGIGVFYPDKKPTQGIGIIPDVVVRPTIAGIRAGRDEVLEEALRQILGNTTSSDEIQKMARPSGP